MPDLPFTDAASKAFLLEIDRIRLEAVKLFSRLKDNLTAEQLQAIIASPRMEILVMEELGFNKNIDKLMLNYNKILLGTTQFAPINEITLRALKAVKRAEWVAVAKFEIGAIQNEIFNASITGQWNQKTIMNNLMTGVQSNLSEGQINTLIDTSLSTYERNVTTAMMNEMPDDTLYDYVGPLDGKTREICLEMIGAGPLTKDEIISRFGASVLHVGGGFNCRHRWAISTMTKAERDGI